MHDEAILTTLIERWGARGWLPSNRPSVDEITERLGALGVVVDDFTAAYFALVGGMHEAVVWDDDLLAFWNFDRACRNYVACGRPGLFELCDWSIDAHVYALDARGTSPSVVVDVGEYRELVSPSWKTFLETYLDDPDSVVAWRRPVSVPPRVER